VHVYTRTVRVLYKLLYTYTKARATCMYSIIPSKVCILPEITIYEGMHVASTKVRCTVTTCVYKYKNDIVV
jgi:hypothetical protein